MDHDDEQGGVPTRFLVISDTHTADTAPSSQTECAFRKPLPPADVAIHAGDLTIRGHILEYEKTLAMLKDIRAGLKLVIAGNHDLSLDKSYRDTDDEEFREARAFWTGQPARDAGVTFLDEGTHCFALANGASLTVHASPYTPEFCAMAFPYERDEDRFNPAATAGLAGLKATATDASLIPDFPRVDVLVTHGPPAGHLDVVAGGKEQHVGCEALANALPRVRPRMHCFGHIHEAWGAQRLAWGDGRAHVEAVGPSKPPGDAVAVDAIGYRHGADTLLVNAAIMNLAYRPRNAPWLVDLTLSRNGASAGSGARQGADDTQKL